MTCILSSFSSEFRLTLEIKPNRFVLLCCKSVCRIRFIGEINVEENFITFVDLLLIYASKSDILSHQNGWRSKVIDELQHIKLKISLSGKNRYFFLETIFIIAPEKYREWDTSFVYSNWNLIKNYKIKRKTVLKKCNKCFADIRISFHYFKFCAD